MPVMSPKLLQNWNGNELTATELGMIMPAFWVPLRGVVEMQFSPKAFTLGAVYLHGEGKSA